MAERVLLVVVTHGGSKRWALLSKNLAWKLGALQNPLTLCPALVMSPVKPLKRNGQIPGYTFQNVTGLGTAGQGFCWQEDEQGHLRPRDARSVAESLGTAAVREADGTLMPLFKDKATEVEGHLLPLPPQVVQVEGAAVDQKQNHGKGHRCYNRAPRVAREPVPSSTRCLPVTSQAQNHQISALPWVLLVQITKVFEDNIKMTSTFPYPLL